MFFKGWPAKRSAKIGLQATSKPLLAGSNGVTATPRPCRMSAQPPVEPSRGQLAPPRARTTTSAGTLSPSSKINSPSGFHPRHSLCMWNRTPWACRRPIQARSRGEAFRVRGKTRPLEPMKVGWPSPSAHAVRSAGVKASRTGRIQAAASPYRATKALKSSEWVRLSPPRPAIRNLRPRLGIRS